MVRLDRRSSEGMGRGICRVGKLIFSPFKFMAKGHGEAFHCHVLCELWSGFGFPVWWPFRDLLTRDSRLKAGEQRAEFVLMKRLTDVWGVATSLYVVPTRMSVSGGWVSWKSFEQREFWERLRTTSKFYTCLQNNTEVFQIFLNVLICPTTPEFTRLNP